MIISFIFAFPLHLSIISSMTIYYFLDYLTLKVWLTSYGVLYVHTTQEVLSNFRGLLTV